MRAYAATGDAYLSRPVSIVGSGSARTAGSKTRSRSVVMPTALGTGRVHRRAMEDPFTPR